MRKLLFLFPLLSTLAQAEWKKHVVTEAKGMINSAGAADWNADGKIDVIASLDGKVVLLRGQIGKPTPCMISARDFPAISRAALASTAA